MVTTRYGVRKWRELEEELQEQGMEPQVQDDAEKDVEGPKWATELEAVQEGAETERQDQIQDLAMVLLEEGYGSGCVIKVDTEARVVEVIFLHPPLPAKSYVYPQHQDVLEVNLSDVLTLVSLSTATGLTYSLTAKEVAAATSALEAKA